MNENKLINHQVKKHSNKRYKRMRRLYKINTMRSLDDPRKRKERYLETRQRQLRSKGIIQSPDEIVWWEFKMSMFDWLKLDETIEITQYLIRFGGTFNNNHAI